MRVDCENQEAACCCTQYRKAQSDHGEAIHIMSTSLRGRQVETARLRGEEVAAAAARGRQQLEQTVRDLQQEVAAERERMRAVQVRG